MVFENRQDGTLWIYDWKRCKQIEYEPFSKHCYAKTPCLAHLPDTNFWHYSLQLNLYKFILESKYGKRVSKMSLVCLHPDNYCKSYELFEINAMPVEIAALYDLRQKQVMVVDNEEEESEL